MTGGPPRPAKLPTLDTGRFLAALLVALFHNSFTVLNLTGKQPLEMVFRGGHSGVEYFFLLSGFIIFHVHRHDLGHADRLADFARKRAIRIVPMLWLVLIPWGVLKLVSAGAATGAPITPLGFVLDLFLVPHPGGSILGVTWTLRCELIFYLVFAAAIVHRGFGIGLLVVWQGLIVIQAIHPFFMLGPDPGMLLGLSNLGFGLGIAVAALMARLPVPRPRAVIAAGIALYVGVMIAEWIVGGPVEAGFRTLGDRLNTLFYLAAALVLLIGMVSWDLRTPGRRIAGAETLGGASYALYLVHLPVGSVAVRALRPLWPILPAWALLAVLTALGIAVAVAVHLWVEQPLLGWLRRPSRAA